jgi:hypothetical protein
MSKDHALIQYYKLVEYFDKLEILGIHLKYLIENTKSEDDLNYIASRIPEFHLMLTDGFLLKKASKEITELYKECGVDINNISSDEDINNRIKTQLIK